MSDYKPLDRQVENGDSVTIEDVKQFVAEAKKKQEDFRLIADRSWNEIEKRNKMGKIYGGNDLDRARKWTKFPLWWSCWKIRQPITLARLAIPVLKDTQGDDPYGRTACVIGERFARGILKTFDAFSEFSASNDDFLVTNFGWGRWCYRSEETQEEEKIRLIVQEQEPLPPELGPDGEPLPDQAPPEPLPPLFFTPEGDPVDPSMVQEDDLGPYVLSGQMVSVENEEVYFEAGNYAGLLVDPDAVRWNKVTRITYEYPYSYREFKTKFGQKALDTLGKADIQDYKDGKKPIMVYEYHDSVLREIRWFADNSEDFFQPVEMVPSEGEGYDNSDIYGLANFFTCTEPLIINQSTRCFWPTPEYFQVQDILDDINSIVTRMLQLTKAVRIRFMFDSSVKELKSLIGENWATGEGTGMGIPNLQQSLMNNGGNLAQLVAYFPIDELMKGLQNMYVAYDQRLNMFYNITGFSDLIRGQTSDAEKTYGERQLEGKFALNRMEPYQRKVQEWIKDNYQLGMEMGLKMFSDETIDEYITPQTLDPEDKQRYVPALELLKNNRRNRFRMDFETDSTISINQDWKKKQAIETANAITKMMESVAKTAAEMPELADSELRIMKHVVAELTDGKLFMDEITDAIQKTIDKVNEPKEEEPNLELEKLRIDAEMRGQELQLATRKQEFEEAKAMTDDRLTQLEMQMKEGIEAAKIAQKSQYENLSLQLEQFKLQAEAGQSASELNLKAQQLQSEIAIAQEELAGKRQEFLLAAQEIASKTEVKQLELILDQRVAEQKQKLEELYAGVEAQQAMLAEREKWITEQRLQEEHKLNISASMIQMQKTLAEMKTSPTPVVVQLEKPKGKRRKRSGRIIRDEAGDATSIEIDDDGDDE
jgi:hypothetical protein